MLEEVTNRPLASAVPPATLRPLTMTLTFSPGSSLVTVTFCVAPGDTLARVSLTPSLTGAVVASVDVAVGPVPMPVSTTLRAALVPHRTGTVNVRDESGCPDLDRPATVHRASGGASARGLRMGQRGAVGARQRGLLEARLLSTRHPNRTGGAGRRGESLLLHHGAHADAGAGVGAGARAGAAQHAETAEVRAAGLRALESER